MIKILNDLPSFCEDCPYTHLVFKEKLGSGINAYTCKFLHICERVYNKALEETDKVSYEQALDGMKSEYPTGKELDAFLEYKRDKKEAKNDNS